MRANAYLFIALLLMAGAGAAEVSFSTKPAAARDGEKVKIAFALAAPGDVEVAVLAADGKVARHLAAGVLGGKQPPPEPLQPGLAQTIVWDGKDDFGKPAGGGPFQVRVRAGMGVAFGRMIGGSPYTGTLGGDSIALAPDGTIFVKMGSFVPQLHAALPWHLRQFDRAGRYVKTLLPYAPSTAPARTPGFRLLDAGDGQMTPANTNPLDPALFRFGDVIHNKIVDGSIVFVDNSRAMLTFFKVDGSNAVRTVPMRTSADKLKWPQWLAPQVAFSPDGRFAYYSNVANTPYDGKKPSDIDPNFPQGRIYRQDLAGAGANPERFYDLVLPDWEATKYWMPSAWDKKTAAAGIAVDSRGQVFVGDLVNQEVVEISPEGKKVSATKVPWPDKVLVSGKSGALYVVSCAVSRGYRPLATLIKITGRGAEAKEAARMPLRELGQALALDESGPVPALWLASGAELVRVEDRGDSWGPAEPSIVNPDKDAIGFVCFGDVDTEAELVYVTSGMGPVWRYNGETGEGGLGPIKACDVAIGPTGMIYGWGDTGSWAGPVARYTRDWKPAPLASTGKHTFGHVYGRYGRGNNAPGMDVDWQGRVYAVCGFNDCHVRVYDAEGNLVDFGRQSRFGDEKGKPTGPAFISYVLDQGGSLRVDPAGNVYVLELGPPPGIAPPRGFEKEPMFQQCTGAIYKFTPKGGEFKKGPKGQWVADGAVRTYSVACGPISGSWESTGSCCHCMRPRFDVDAFGRLYIPNGVTYKVTVLDNTDNEIVRFGAYGNYDCAGPRSAIPKPEIPMGWPAFAGASDKYIYIGDSLNHRVVRVDKTWRAEETCEVK